MAKSIFDGSKWDEQMYTAKDALATRPPTQYVIKPVFAIPSLCMVYGEPGSYKTNLLMDAAVCVALGKKWLENESDPAMKGYETTKSPVLWIDCDSGEEILHERFGAMLRYHAKNKAQAEQAPIYYMSFPNPPFTAIEDAAVNEVISRANKLQAKLIVFDNLVSVSGGLDENTSQMSKVLHGLRFIAQKTKAAVVPIHHEPRYGNGDTPKQPRGHTSIVGHLDLGLRVTADAEAIAVSITKKRRASIDAFAALFEFTHRPNTQDLQLAHFSGIAAEEDIVSKKARETLVAHLKKNKSGNQSQLADALCALKAPRISRHRAIAEIQRCLLGNVLKEIPHQARNQTIYQLHEEKK